MSKNSSSGVSFGGVLFIAFLVLKLTDNIDWSWWWVTAPLWLPIAAILIIGGLCLAVTFIIDSIKYKGNK